MHPSLTGAVPALEWLALQTVDPSIVTAAPGEARAVASLISTVVFGGAVIYRYGGRLDDAVDASMDEPLYSVVYGLMAYALVVFAVAYAFSQLAQIGVGQGILALVGAAVLAVFVLSLGGLGFVVVGAWLTDAVGTRDPWFGLVGVAAVVALAWFFLPFLPGLAVWLAVAAVGIGGPVRKWIHGSRVEPAPG